ncbi:unnamed protein product, partial [Ectocarpus sp. 12 AP-2014]
MHYVCVMIRCHHRENVRTSHACTHAREGVLAQRRSSRTTRALTTCRVIYTPHLAPSPQPPAPPHEGHDTTGTPITTRKKEHGTDIQNTIEPPPSSPAAAAVATEQSPGVKNNKNGRQIHRLPPNVPRNGTRRSPTPNP